MKKRKNFSVFFKVALFCCTMLLFKNTLLANQNYENKLITGNVVDKKTTMIKGVVYDDQKFPLIGASVSIKGTTIGVSTDLDGKFKLKLSDTKDVILKISFIGMETVEVDLKKQKNLKDIKVYMKTKKQTLDEVVVTGYANINKKSFTGSSVDIKKEDILKVSPNNIMQALQAFDPSIRLVQNNEFGSNPNKLPEFYVRGKSSIGVLDKSQISESNLKNNPNMPTFIMDGYEVSVEKVYDLDPQRIENITILKDAAATAIYGSRATNGIIVITTKSPEPGKLTVNYIFNASLTAPDISDYNLYDAKGKLELEREAGMYASHFDNNKDEILRDEYYKKLYEINRGVDTYWLSKPLRTSFNHKHTLYIEGGTKGVRFGLDLKSDNQNGVMKKSFRNRKGFGFTLQYNIGKLMLKNYISWNVMNSEESPYGSFSTYTKINPFTRPINDKGEYNKTLDWHDGTPLPNPLYDATLSSYDKSKYSELANNFSFQYLFNDHLRFKGRYSFTYKSSEHNVFVDPTAAKFANNSIETTFKKGKKDVNKTIYEAWDANGLLIYNNNFGDHNLNSTLGFNAKEDVSDFMGFYLEGFPTGAMDDINFAAQIINKPSGQISKTRLLGAFFSTNYTYKNTYLLDFSYRIDGGSQFGTDKKFAPFWSIGVGLNLNKYEIFNYEWLNQFKVRATYGQTGKTNFPPNAAQTMYKYYTDTWYISGCGATLAAMGNDKLKWEKTNSYDFGADVSALNNRLTVRADYYYKKTKDLIASITIPSSTGFKMYRSNLGEIENKGYEFFVRGEIIKNSSTNLSIYTSLSHNENKILKISNSLEEFNKEIDETQQTNINKAPVLRYKEGASLTAIYAMKSLGVNPANGKEVFLDKEGNVTYEWRGSDNIQCGDTEPEALGSLGFNLYHKGFTLYANFMYEFGGQMYNQTLVNKVEDADIRFNVDKRVGDSRWRKPGDIASMQTLKLRSPHSTLASSRFIQDNNTIRLSSLSLGYVIPKDIVKKWKMSRLHIQLNTQDLFRISSIKQERGTTYPFARTFNLTLNASF